MSSTYSPLKVQLMADGENDTTWGGVTNINLGTTLEEAITQTANITFASADVTLTLTNTNTTQPARRARLNLIGTTGGAARNLILPVLQKFYIVNNACANTITVKNPAGTGIAVVAGASVWVYNDGINVISAISSLGSPLAAASGGTGLTGGVSVGDTLTWNGTAWAASPGTTLAVAVALALAY